MRYRLTVSPRAPRRHAGYLAGLVLLVLAVSGILLAGMLANVVTHTAATALAAL